MSFGRSRLVSAALAALAALASLGLLTSCSKGGRDAFDPNPSLLDGGMFTPEGGALVQCAEATKDIFVIAEDRSFYSFHPPTGIFTNKGVLDCPTGGATPTSMAVDRAGFAWVRHSDGSVWKVSTADLTCELTKFQAQAEAFTKFGMGFATETKGGNTEVLYLSDSNGGGLAKLDTTTLAFGLLGPYTGALAGTAAELTGTGDGKLYGFFVTSPAQVAEISKSNGSILTTKELTGVYGGTAWAFSFYGGDFYIYTNNDTGSLPVNGGGSDVTRYSPADGSITVVKSKIGFKIVGAGVSTCAPTTAVR